MSSSTGPCNLNQRSGEKRALRVPSLRAGSASKSCQNTGLIRVPVSIRHAWGFGEGCRGGVYENENEKYQNMLKHAYIQIIKIFVKMICFLRMYKNDVEMI